ncbi:hypothetical protein PU629_03815 [Pullulanibacillus sp. KACC 23026]|nr:hypothetical protein [Pullulanibacillus sp. KACC 23026]WEG13505.1 hypothetical protein PU629_03815 [Pullulanibacillus sp. KACC 23026]
MTIAIWCVVLWLFAVFFYLSLMTVAKEADERSFQNYSLAIQHRDHKRTR